MKTIKNQYSFYSPHLPENLFITDEKQYHQITKVFRLKKGSSLIFSNGQGEKAIYTIQDILKNGLNLLRQKTTSQSKPAIKIHLVVGAVKRETLKIILRQSTELGVSDFHIVESQYSETKIDLLTKKHEYFNTVIKEAFEQSMRFYKPSLFFYKSWDAFTLKKEGRFLVAHPSSVGGFIDKDFVQKDTENIFLLIGPEGGFSNDEILFFQKNKAQLVSLSQNILKVDTASTTAVGQLTQVIY